MSRTRTSDMQHGLKEVSIESEVKVEQKCKENKAEKRKGAREEMMQQQQRKNG